MKMLKCVFILKRPFICGMHVGRLILRCYDFEKVYFLCFLDYFFEVPVSCMKFSCVLLEF